MKIGKINIKDPLLLAPMAGITDKAFRIICKKLGASIVYTEFDSSEGIIRENIKVKNIEVNWNYNHDLPLTRTFSKIFSCTSFHILSQKALAYTRIFHEIC